MDSEKIYMKDGNLIDPHEQELYYYRRLHLRNYLKDIFRL